MSERLMTELIQRIGKLDDARAEELLKVVKSLEEPKTLVAYADWRKLAGAIPSAALDEMERVITEEFEQIEREMWGDAS